MFRLVCLHFTTRRHEDGGIELDLGLLAAFLDHRHSTGVLSSDFRAKMSPSAGSVKESARDTIICEHSPPAVVSGVCHSARLPGSQGKHRQLQTSLPRSPTGSLSRGQGFDAVPFKLTASRGRASAGRDGWC
jgi:hypothetical protein